MKKIFLVTWFTSENYGTCLQAYATHRILTESGNRVCFLDRRMYYPFIKSKYLVEKAVSKIKSRLYAKETFNYGKYQNDHAKKVEKTKRLVNETYARKNIVSKKDVKSIDEGFDCYLVGSDQMWNPWVMRPQYLLDFVPTRSNKPKYAYAASFGVDSIPCEKTKLYKKYLPRFDNISVREETALKFVNEFAGKRATVVLDPTFLLTQKEWRDFSLKSVSVSEHGLKKYILCYFLGEVYDHLSTVKQIANVLGMKVAILAMRESDYQCDDPEVEVIADACAYDFISLIDNAGLVCTDSFHAVVFSFQMNTPFYYYPRFKEGDVGSQDTRLINIMKKFKLNDSIWKHEFDREDIEKHLVTNYKPGYDILERERTECKAFLLDMIEGEY